MSKPMISADGLGKKYSLGQKQPYYAFRDVLDNVLKGKLAEKSSDEFWALKDVSFEIPEGDVVGVVGGNGAGKSTLLKILSQITPPTVGSVRLNGRVASLLEVGTGFHPELTGKENIYLNGAILGMKRWEINNKFDDIVEFAEISKFLDTPVKHYSSGMYMRLAFAVAAHLEPEILLIDEVLAVGDAAFQKRCLGKMNEISKTAGRTILFVSHNMGAIQQLCSKTLLFKQGHLIKYDKTEKVISKYLSETKLLSDVSLDKRKDRSGSGNVVFTSMSIGTTPDGKAWSCGDNVYVDATICNKTDDTQTGIEVAYEIQKNDNTPLLYLGTKIMRLKINLKPRETKNLRCEIPNLPLEPGSYNLISEIMVEGTLNDLVSNAIPVDVSYGDFYGTGNLWPRSGILCKYIWKYK